MASTWAEEFHRAGYLDLRPRARSEWDAISAELRDLYNQRDARRSQVVATHGEPTLSVGGNVLCYTPDDGGPWLFFDFARELSTRYVEGRGAFAPDERAEDPLLRAIRVPAPTFEDGLVMTLYGRVLRWGTGWWIDHPDRGAIGAQLRSIAQSEPSDPRNYRG